MTWTESWSLIKKNIWLRDAIWKFGYNTAPNVSNVYKEIIALFVANIASGQVNSEVENITTSIESVRESISNAISQVEDGIDNAFLTLGPVMTFPATAFTASMRKKLREFMNVGYAKTGTNWTFTNGNTALPCGGVDGNAVAEFVVGQKVYLQGHDPKYATEIAVIVSDDSITLVGGGYLGANGVGTIMRCETVTSRAIARGAITALTNNAGSGSIKRYYTDEYGYASDAGIAGITNYKCIRDPLTGAKENNSTFLLSMTGQLAKDHLDNQTAIDDTQTIVAITSDDNKLLTNNVDFSRGDGAAGPTTKIPGWIVNTPASFTRHEELTGTTPDALVYTYKKKRGTVSATNINGIGYALEVSATPAADVVCKRKLTTAALVTNKPYFVSCMFKGEAGANGNVYIELRDSADVVLAQSTVGAIGAGFGELELNFWFQNVDASPLYICLVRKTVGVGVMYFSNFIFAGYDAQYNGVWHKALQGQADFLVANPTDKLPDGYNATDTIAAEALINRHLQDTYSNYYLPHATVPTIIAPA